MFIVDKSPLWVLAEMSEGIESKIIIIITFYSFNLRLWIGGFTGGWQRNGGNVPGYVKNL